MYTLNIKGKCIVLTPINKGVVIETDLNKHISLSLSQFMKEMKNEMVVYALMLDSGVMQEEVEDNPIEIQGVLIEFKDMIP